MKNLNKLQLAIYALGGLLMLAGAMLMAFLPVEAPYIFCVGSLMFAAMQFCASYEGDNVVIRRLRRQQLFGAVLFMLAGASMFANKYIVEFTSVQNVWILFLTIGTLLQTYSIFRLSHELKKEEQSK